jgi:PBSX family phage terminase large subunit
MTLTFSKFSKKQLLTLKWWNLDRYSDYDAIICDGAIRSGKTVSMSLGFVLWAMARFKGGTFALCGKTVTSLRRNVVTPLLGTLNSLEFSCCEKVSKHYFEVTACNVTNRFYLFGGKDEGSSALIQGITLCGVFFDEVALMPRSFVEQALARCSVNGSKLWFNCNPDNPYHWFYREWIKKSEEKHALYLHFTMEDNPSLTRKIKDRYERMYSGIFYDRFVLGKWTVSSGVVYPMFDVTHHVVKQLPYNFTRYVVSCDYGIINPTSIGLWGYSDGIWFRINEYYYDSKEHGKQLHTDEEYYQALESLTAGLDVETVIVDPSASSFIECIRRHGRFRVTKANNDVLYGIRLVSDALNRDSILLSEKCTGAIKEFSQYCWNEKLGRDVPIKEHDHAMDDIRYFVTYALKPYTGDDFYCYSLARE